MYQGAQYDASVTNLTYRIPSHDSKSEHVEIVLSFLSPVTPSSTLRQSIPASYLSIHVTGSFDIDIYVDLNGQWVSGDRGSEIVWELENAETEKLKSWVVKRKDELVFAEWNDRAEWGSLRFTGPSVSMTLPALPCPVLLPTLHSTELTCRAGRPSRKWNIGCVEKPLLPYGYPTERERRALPKHHAG